MTEENETLIEFPCDFPIKIIGNKNSIFSDAVAEIVCRHFPGFDVETMVIKESAQGNYLAITVTVFAENKMMLDAFYMEITQHPEIKMVL